MPPTRQTWLQSSQLGRLPETHDGSLRPDRRWRHAGLCIPSGHSAGRWPCNVSVSRPGMYVSESRVGTVSHELSVLRPRGQCSRVTAQRAARPYPTRSVGALHRTDWPPRRRCCGTGTVTTRRRSAASACLCTVHSKKLGLHHVGARPLSRSVARPEARFCESVSRLASAGYTKRLGVLILRAHTARSNFCELEPGA